jgi:hypothetical protein
MKQRRHSLTARLFSLRLLFHRGLHFNCRTSHEVGWIKEKQSLSLFFVGCLCQGGTGEHQPTQKMRTERMNAALVKYSPLSSYSYPTKKISIQSLVTLRI